MPLNSVLGVIKNLFLICVAFQLAACALAERQSRDLSTDITGVWHLQDNGDDAYAFSQLAFLADGRKCVVSIDIAGPYSEIDAYINQWEIENNVLVTTFGLTSRPEDLGDTMRDEIMRLDKSRLDLWMIEPDGSRLEIHRKLDEVLPERICELALFVITEKIAGQDD